MGVCDKYPGQGQTRYSLLGQGYNNGIGDSKEQELITVISCIVSLDTRVTHVVSCASRGERVGLTKYKVMVVR